MTYAALFLAVAVAGGCLGLEECGARRVRGGEGGCVALDDDVASALVLGGAPRRGEHRSCITVER
jgi:hypothetical protein